MRGWGVSIAVLATALIAATAQPAEGSRYLRVGIYDQAQLLYGPTEATYALYKKLNVQEVRMTLYWGGSLGVARSRPAHPANPADPAYRWTIYDNIVVQAARDGMHVVFSIYGTPSWANGGKGLNVVPSHPFDLREFAQAAARHYSGNFTPPGGVQVPAVRDWLAWNEPNNPVFLTPQFRRVRGRWVAASALSYAKICNAVYNGVHAVHVSERVGCGVTAPRGNNDPTSSRPSISPLAFLRAVKRDGLVTFDAWADHPYYSNPSDSPASRTVGQGSVELGNIDDLIGLLTQLYGNKRVWITEYGYETNPPDSFFGVSWSKQAAYLTEAFAIARRNPRIDMMLWFLLKDDRSINGWQSGLITAGGKKKPSFAAFERMALESPTRSNR